ncbi:hypothetical protein POTOM_002237 [Populus tomentosa]|uniref:Retrovirus-related Pol polyprotein from transposon TNT 1-94-like beta-barrel domain-containing protein n=1 Tax=Populus tomentosa TaxID=118781 RepID=A0A8X8IZ01_POPTO|nr:hypothetical protein POTOM_002237 [Populus tomentosa]
MSDKNIESSGMKSVPVIVQSNGFFNAGIILTKSNYDVWSQLMEMHIAEREKLSYIRGKTKPPAETEDGYEKCSLSKAFYDGSDELQVFALNQKAFTAKQSSKSLSEYYEELTEVFRELDHRDKVVMTDPEDIVAYRKSIERLRVHIFLAGLNVRHATLKGESGNPEASAMVARHRSNQNLQNHPKTNNGTDKSTYKCTQCNQTGHTKSRCFELVGYPEWWDHSHDTRKKNSKRPSTAAMVETKTEDDVAEKASALVLTANNGDHMTFDSRQVSTLNSSLQKFISTANGASTPVIEEGSVTLTSTLNLDSVLVVPSLDYNLLSVSQITKTLSCVVIFWPEFCVFKDIRTKQTIGYGIRQGKLYYLDLVPTSSSELPKALTVDGSEGEKKKWENQKEIQTLDYDGLNYTHNSEESESPESSNLDVGNLDQSGITLDSSGDVSQAGPVNHEVGELDLSGMSLDTSEDESLEAEDVAPLSESNPCIIPNQSSAADVPDMVSEPFLKQLPQRHTRVFEFRFSSLYMISIRNCDFLLFFMAMLVIFAVFLPQFHEAYGYSMTSSYTPFVHSSQAASPFCSNPGSRGIAIWLKLLDTVFVPISVSIGRFP